MNADRRRLLAAIIAGTQLTACATEPKQPLRESVLSAVQIESAPDRLGALAELEAFDPVRDDLSVAISLIDPTFPRALDAGSEAHRRATSTLSSIIQQFPVPTPAGSTEPVSIERQAAATKLYTRARLSRQSNDPGQAVTLMEQAVQADPNAPALWRELGEAQFASGDRIGAGESLRLSAELGDRDARVLRILASESASRNELDEVVRWAGAMIDMESEAADEDRIIGGSMLGSALIERGNLRAGARALGDAIQTLDALAPAPGEATELTRLRVRRAEIEARIGDAWIALDEPTQGEIAYERAFAMSARAPSGVVQRLIAAKIAAGRPADAALFLIEHLNKNAGDLGPEEPQWLRGIASIDRVGEATFEAINELAIDDERALSARRQVLQTLIRGELDATRAAAHVQAAGETAFSAVVVGDLLWRTENDARLGIALDAVSRNPLAARSYGAALSRMTSEPAALARKLAASDDQASRTLALGVALEVRAPDTVRGIIEAGPSSVLNATVGAELSGRAGWWALGTEWLDAARNGVTNRARLLEAMIACQQLEEAQQLALEVDTNPDAPIEDVLAAAEIASVMGDPALFVARIDRASKLDPFDERVWERRVTLATLRGEGDEGETLRDVGRKLSETRPRSALFAMLRARELGSQGRLSDAADLIMAIGEREPSRDLGLSLLVQAADASMIQQPGSGVIERVNTWLSLRYESVPGSVAGLVALARVIAIDDAGVAIEMLDAGEERFGHPEVARTAEQILATELNSGESAALRVLSRTESTSSIDGLLDRAEAARFTNEPGIAISALRKALPEGGTLNAAQRQRWQVLVLTLAQSTDGDKMDVDVAQGLLGLLDIASQRVMPMPDALVRARVILLARTGQTNRLRTLVDTMSLSNENGLLVVQALLGSEQRDAGLDLLAQLALGNGTNPTINSELIEEWTRLVGAGGQAERIRVLLGLIETPERAFEVAELLRERYQLSEIPGDGSEARDRADIAYACALIATVFDRERESEGMYRLCLELDVNHAWACNDLGYALADRGESLQEANRWASRAYELLGTEASVLDTLGWARYKLGVLEDEFNAAGDVVREGAVTLLTRASLMEDGKDNATIFQHLGDALWRLDRRDDALQAWNQADSLLASRALEIAAQENPNPRQRDYVTESLSEVRRRLESVKSDREPKTSPIPSLDYQDSLIESRDRKPDGMDFHRPKFATEHIIA